MGFQGAIKFNQPTSSLVTGGVTDMSDMFNNAIDYNSAIFSSTGAVKDFNNMFNAANKFNQAIGGWIVTNTATGDATSQGMAGMFQGAQNFNQDLDGWTPTTCEKFENMFDGASRFDGKIFAGTGSGKTMDSMFKGASSFTGKNAENMETNTCADFDYLFNGASAFNTAIVASGNKWNVASGTTFIDMFRDASSFNQDIANWDMPNIATTGPLATMFSGATNFQQNLCEWNVHLNTAIQVTDMFVSTRCSQTIGDYTTNGNNAEGTSCCDCDGADDATNYPACQ